VTKVIIPTATLSRCSTTIQKLLLFSVFFLSLSHEALAVRPISATIALVAGQEGRAGFKDGSFTSALFNTPLGLSVSDDGTQLFVADSGNNRIRIIHLDQNNDVTTLTGQTLAGKLDGPLEKAQFNNPHGVLYLPGERLVVNDFGNQLLRLVDLKAGTVSTLTPVPVNGVRDMAYMPSADSIFFSQPDISNLKRLDLKTGLISTVLNNNTQLPHPAALWCQANKLYIADKDLPQVDELDWKDNTPANPVSVATTLANILSLSWNGDILYALLENPGVPAERLFLDSNNVSNTTYSGQFNNKLVSFRSPWGDTIPPEALYPAADMSYAPSTGFVPDSSDDRKFYVAKPDQQTIVSFRDLFGFDWSPQPGGCNSNHVNEPEYPAKKPKNTYRILIVGDSRSAEIQAYPFPTDFHPQRRNDDFPQNLFLSKQIERELNFQAALDETSLNFEVFNSSLQGDLYLWPTYELPDIVKRNDIDLVVIFMPRAGPDFSPYKFYFDHPITSEGIPQYPNDMEYVLKPPLERIPNGMPRNFYNFCKAHNLVRIEGNVFNFDESLLSHPELHDALVEMYGKPLDVLNQKLLAMKTSSGQPVRVLLCTTHTTQPYWGNLEDPQIWADAAKKYNFRLLETNPEITAFWFSFYPLAGNDIHLNPDGHDFFGRLLAHDLVRDKLIPWK